MSLPDDDPVAVRAVPDEVRERPAELERHLGGHRVDVRDAAHAVRAEQAPGDGDGGPRRRPRGGGLRPVPRAVGPGAGDPVQLRPRLGHVTGRHCPTYGCTRSGSTKLAAPELDRALRGMDGLDADAPREPQRLRAYVPRVQPGGLVRQVETDGAELGGVHPAEPCPGPREDHGHLGGGRLATRAPAGARSDRDRVVAGARASPRTTRNSPSAIATARSASSRSVRRTRLLPPAADVGAGWAARPESPPGPGRPGVTNSAWSSVRSAFSSSSRWSAPVQRDRDLSRAPPRPPPRPRRPPRRGRAPPGGGCRAPAAPPRRRAAGGSRPPPRARPARPRRRRGWGSGGRNTDTISSGESAASSLSPESTTSDRSADRSSTTSAPSRRRASWTAPFTTASIALACAAAARRAPARPAAASSGPARPARGGCPTGTGRSRRR